MGYVGLPSWANHPARSSLSHGKGTNLPQHIFIFGDDSYHCHRIEQKRHAPTIPLIYRFCSQRSISDSYRLLALKPDPNKFLFLHSSHQSASRRRQIPRARRQVVVWISHNYLCDQNDWKLRGLQIEASGATYPGGWLAPVSPTCLNRVKKQNENTTPVSKQKHNPGLPYILYSS